MMMQTPAADSAGVIEATRQAFWTGRNGLWLPPAESTTAPQIDALFNFIMISSIILTLFVAAAMVYFVRKYRRTSHADRPQETHENKWLEVSWIVIPTILVLGVFFWGFRAYVGTAIPPSNAITVNVKAQKWNWSFEYANGTNATELVVPVNQPVRLEMTSQDVLHSFYVPEFRIKHDVLPNRFAYVWFEAPREGVYQILCTEYCGTSHSNMGARIRVVSRGDYYAYVANGYLPGEQPPAMAPADLGASVYVARGCNACHSVDGTPGVGPSWEGIWGEPRPGSAEGVVDDVYIANSILYPQAYIAPGFENANMPSYDGVLNDQQIAGVAAYIRVLSGAATPADTTLPTDAGIEDSLAGQAPEGGMGDPGVPVADPVDGPAREEVRE
ncbi:cytochrome c oxidase subunit II [Rubrivirga sp. S365]|uniref:cytochrome c oxidase subunit II n=1 Tax=Rubrivirga sp. S365 TaxID=3076080 RepID=UPI0028C86FD0|nr:cytochrome c oxidase subunit II [Rubrivirga sp. S365]MDT7855927.1 cytochrome c oxidase subunit II [Rubrivirga sp. S365]